MDSNLIPKSANHISNFLLEKVFKPEGYTNGQSLYFTFLLLHQELVHFNEELFEKMMKDLETNGGGR